MFGRSLLRIAPRLVIAQLPKLPVQISGSRLNYSIKAQLPSVSRVLSKSLPVSARPLPKKRNIKKRYILNPNVLAYSTCEEYNLETIARKLEKQELYDVTPLPEETETLHAEARYVIDDQHRDIFFFKEGSVVFWNFTETEAQTVLDLLRACENQPYDNEMVQEEQEMMEFQFHNSKSRLLNGKICLKEMSSVNETESNSSQGQGNHLEMYAFSNAIALSVKLSIWEATLEKYIESIESMLHDITRGRKLATTRDHIFQKTGELFALRHHLNLSSDLLDTPDFYWDREDLESLFNKTARHLSIERRTRVMNEKINHCQELMELISHHLEDNHHVRLELMIIILIIIEVIFEIVHYAERFVITEEPSTH